MTPPRWLNPEAAANVLFSIAVAGVVAWLVLGTSRPPEMDPPLPVASELDAVRTIEPIPDAPPLPTLPSYRGRRTVGPPEWPR